MKWLYLVAAGALATACDEACPGAGPGAFTIVLKSDAWADADYVIDVTYDLDGAPRAYRCEVHTPYLAWDGALDGGLRVTNGDDAGGFDPTYSDRATRRCRALQDSGASAEVELKIGRALSMLLPGAPDTATVNITRNGVALPQQTLTLADRYERVHYDGRSCPGTDQAVVSVTLP